MDLADIKKVHFFGIGGIGVSAVAGFFINKGVRVSGSDTTESEAIIGLKKLGAEIKIGGQSTSEIPEDADLAVYSAAIEVAEPKLFADIKKSVVPSKSYAEILGMISKSYKTVAISGTHGKTTTTAMVAEILRDAGLNPTVIVGGFLKNEKTNFVAGAGEYLVVEADDYRESFLELFPYVLVVTNIGKDHLEYYGNMENVKKAFGKLAAKLPSGGTLIAEKNDRMVKDIWEKVNCQKINYGDFVYKELMLQVPGEHNKRNAGCALAVASALGLDLNDAKKSLEGFPGTWRRFDFRGHTKAGVFVYDDYAHNPDKVKAALQGYREKFPKSKITVIFQPHLYSRTKLLLGEFSGAFGLADKVLVLPIYAAREKPDTGISSEILVEEIKKNGMFAVEYVSDFKEAADKASGESGKGDCVVTMGAGDVNKVVDILISELNF